MLTIRGPRPTADEFQRSQLPSKKALRQPDRIRALRRDIAAVRDARRRLMSGPPDWLMIPIQVRLIHRRWAKQREAELARECERDGARRALIAAARIARAKGWSVRASRDRQGRISSYYVSRFDRSAAPIRISDHEIPETEDRLTKAAMHGAFQYDGYRGPQIIITRPRSATWIRRALTLAEAGRL